MKRLQQRIEESERARAELMHLAEEARRRGDLETYWALSSPSDLADLYRIAGDEQHALHYYRQFIEYYRSYRAWAGEHGQVIPPSYSEAKIALRARLDAVAREQFLALRVTLTPERAMLLGIPLVCAGAVQEGRQLLRQRIAWLDVYHSNDPLAWHQDGELAFWLGDLPAAQKYADRAAAKWTGHQPPSVEALRLFYTACAMPTDEELAGATREALEASMRWFYEDGFLDQAVDVVEYSTILGGSLPDQKSHARVLGITILWN